MTEAVEAPITTEDGPMAAALKRGLALEQGRELPIRAAEPAPEPEAPPAEPEAEAPAGDNAQVEGADALPAETVEVEINGKLYQVPSEIKDGYLAQGDYTRNMQALAKQRETVAEREQAAQQALAAMQIAGPLIAEWHNTQGFLQQVAQVDINILRQTDPNGANNLEIEKLKAVQKMQQLGQQLTAIPQALREAEDKAVRDEATRNMPEALKLVPDLPKRQEEFAKAGAKRGFGAQELGRITDPRIIACLRDLAEYDRLTANRDQIKERVAAAPPVARPGARTAPTQATTKEYNQAVRGLRTDRSDDAFVKALRLQRQTKGQ